MCEIINNTCDRCGGEIPVDPESGCLDSYNFDHESNFFTNTQYCSECYDAIVAERKAEDERILGIWETIRETLDKYDISYRENHASTASHYFNCYFDPTNYDVPDDEDVIDLDSIEFKIRVADHSQCYDADINVAINESNADGIPVERFENSLVKFLGIEKKD